MAMCEWRVWTFLFRIAPEKYTLDSAVLPVNGSGQLHMFLFRNTRTVWLPHRAEAPPVPVLAPGGTNDVIFGKELVKAPKVHIGLCRLEGTLRRKQALGTMPRKQASPRLRAPQRTGYQYTQRQGK